jgi:hypothetical protein
MEDTLIIQLEKPINISHNGNLVEVEILNIFLPNMLSYNLYTEINSITTKAMLALQDKIEDKNDTNTNGNEPDDNIIPIDLFVASSYIKDISIATKEYLYKLGKFDDIQVNKNNINKISIRDFNKIIERLAYFLYSI